MENPPIISADLAWAAGVFDGDGTVSGYPRKPGHSRAVQVTVYQATTPVLERFRDVVGGHGGIYGPYRGRLYHWTTKRLEAVAAVCEQLWPALSIEKRQQFELAVRGRPDLASLVDLLRGAESMGVATGTRLSELAWAAGFFDAEGSISTSTSGPPSLEVPQAEVDGKPSSSLLRFQAALGRGRISGPRVVPSAWSKLPQYRWQAGSFEDVQFVASGLWTWLGGEKRADLSDALNAYLAERSRKQADGAGRSGSN
jgi:hypothetical protein